MRVWGASEVDQDFDAVLPHNFTCDVAEAVHDARTVAEIDAAAGAIMHGPDVAVLEAGRERREVVVPEAGETRAATEARLRHRPIAFFPSAKSKHEHHSTSARRKNRIRWRRSSRSLLGGSWTHSIQKVFEQDHV